MNTSDRFTNVSTAQVESTSVTPYSRPSLLRALHAVMVAYVRQRGPVSDVRSPYPIPGKLLESFRSVLVARGAVASPEDVPTLEEIFNQLIAGVGGRGAKPVAGSR